MRIPSEDEEFFLVHLFKLIFPFNFLVIFKVPAKGVSVYR